MSQPFTIGELDKLTESPDRQYTKEALDALDVECASVGNRRVYMLDHEDIAAVREEVERLVEDDEEDDLEDDE